MTSPKFLLVEVVRRVARRPRVVFKGHPPVAECTHEGTNYFSEEEFAWLCEQHGHDWYRPHVPVVAAKKEQAAAIAPPPEKASEQPPGRRAVAPPRTGLTTAGTGVPSEFSRWLKHGDF